MAQVQGRGGQRRLGKPDQILEKFQSIRHVSIIVPVAARIVPCLLPRVDGVSRIVPHLLLGLDKLTQKYASTDAKSKNDPADFKKDLQQALKIA